MYLIDTCALIWILSNPEKLSNKAKQAIESAEKAYVSIASLWEIAIKQGNGKLNLRLTITDIANACKETNIEILFPTPAQLDIVQSLPKIHGDPFDRLIIAQAMDNNLAIITSDNYFPEYKITVLW